MGCIINMLIFSLILLFTLIFTISFALTTFNIKNNCPYTVWAAAIPVGGGQRLDQGQTWTITGNTGTSGGRIWARTGCNVTGPDSLSCLTGDCDGLFQCQCADTSAHCPPEIQVPGGCINPCESGSCGPTTYSQFFKGLCPNASSYRSDDATSTFTCFSGVKYRVVFCP
ncbi:hypothetical protein Droror1_Dr00027199 [Drosera rotundifolia]